MTRKDTILIAVVINAGLLAMLFTTAVIYDTDKGTEQMEFTPLVENNPPQNESPSTLIATAPSGDEVDNVLKYYTSSTPQPIVVSTQPEVYIPESLAINSQVTEDEKGSSGTVNTASAQEQLVEVKVKRGDTLEKIAKANKTTIAAIKRANQLTSERLSIGQILKIPNKAVESKGESKQAELAKVEVKQENSKESKVVEAEPVYYVIKSGDNPWKVAKQFGVKYDEILRLNHMTEEKARNLKVGDRIRVK